MANKEKKTCVAGVDLDRRNDCIVTPALSLSFIKIDHTAGVFLPATTSILIERERKEEFDTFGRV